MANEAAVNGNKLLESVSDFVQRFVWLSPEQAAAIALWVVHTHALEAAVTTPYLNISSAEKQSGKTRLLEVLRALVANPWFTGRASAAALVRKIDAQCPTLLLDESDAAFASDREYAETLRGVLNSGHSRDGVTSLCVGQGANLTFKDFQVFCPKAIAGIGKLPDTVADRSIPIRMKRRAFTEQVERFRPQLVKAESGRLMSDVADWSRRNSLVLKDSRPKLPDQLSDRQQDGAEPLLAIADAVGGEWPERSRSAIVALLTGEMARDDSFGVRLLADIRAVFAEQQEERLGTSELLRTLCDGDPQWRECNHGKELSAAGLARLLKRYGIEHHKIRMGAATAWGYHRADFEDAWGRYLPRSLEHVEQSNNDAVKSQPADLEQIADVPASRTQKSTAFTRVVPNVPDDRRNSVRADYLFHAAVARCREAGQASVSDLMAALGLTRPEAIRYIDEMEDRGLVPPAKGAGPRPFPQLTAAELGFQ